nr:hypothetical protein [Candidatus Sigynarchaeota archaeon]
TINKIGSLPPGYAGGNDIEYILAKAQAKETPEAKKAGLKGDLISSIIDISGSMSGGKLEAVKHNLIQSLKDMAVNASRSGFMLIAFESNVEIYFSPQEAALVLSSDEVLHSEEKLKKFIEKDSIKFTISPVESTSKAWISHVGGLYTKGSTALGPALAAGIDIFIQRGIKGRILLLTDGLANVGFGRLEGEGARDSKVLYERLAKQCLEHGIVVDVIGVGGGNELALDILGKLSELTGGELFFVTQEELDSTFGEISSRHFIGKDVRVKVFTPNAVDLKAVSGISSIAKESKRLQEINVGSVTPDREALFEFEVKEKIKVDEVPVQVQVEFNDADGNKKLRVFKTKLKPEKNEDEYKKDYDPRPLSVMKIQEAGDAYGKGDTTAAKGILQSMKANMANQAAFFAGEEADMSMDILDDELLQIDENEEMKKSKAAKSFSAMAGQKRTRVSYDQKMDEVKKRKK